MTLTALGSRCGRIYFRMDSWTPLLVMGASNREVVGKRLSLS